MLDQLRVFDAGNMGSRNEDACCARKHDYLENKDSLTLATPAHLRPIGS